MRRAEEDLSFKIDFALFLAIWLRDFHGTEQEFWRHWNPVRMNGLLKALNPPPRKPSLREFLGA